MSLSENVPLENPVAELVCVCLCESVSVVAKGTDASVGGIPHKA